MRIKFFILCLAVLTLSSCGPELEPVVRAHLEVSLYDLEFEAGTKTYLKTSPPGDFAGFSHKLQPLQLYMHCDRANYTFNLEDMISGDQISVLPGEYEIQGNGGWVAWEGSVAMSYGLGFRDFEIEVDDTELLLGAFPDCALFLVHDPHGRIESGYIHREGGENKPLFRDSVFHYCYLEASEYCQAVVVTDTDQSWVSSTRDFKDGYAYMVDILEDTLEVRVSTFTSLGQ